MQEFWAPNKFDMQICYQLLLPKSIMNVGTSTSILTAVKVSFINGPTPATFLFVSGLFKQKIQFLQQINVKNDMSIQYMAAGFEPTTSRT